MSTSVSVLHEDIHLADASNASQPEIPPRSSDELPDGGYGWVIVAACSVLTFFFVGHSYSWGVIQARLTAEHLAPPSTLAYIGSTNIAFVSFGAIINTRIIKRLGTRNSGLLGCVLMGLGQLLSSFATRNVGGLFVTNGIIAGFGVSVTFMTCGSLPAQYFGRKRGVANGLVFAGGGLGGGVLSMTLESLINRVGVKWTFRILGFITLAVGIPVSLLLKDRTRRSSVHVEWTLFRDLKFVLLFIGSGLATFPILVPPFFIPLYASSLGFSTGLSSALLAVFNLSSAFGRVGFGVLGDFVGPITSLFLSMLVSAISMLAMWPVSTSLAPFLVFIIINGMGNGGFFSTMPSCVGHMYGPARVPTAFSMVVSAWAAGYFMGPPIAGFILDRYGGTDVGHSAFRPAMYYAGTMSLGSALFTFGVRQQMTTRIFAFA